MRFTPYARLACFLALIIAQRIWELARSSRNERRLRERGGVEHGASHYPILVAIHAAYPVALVLETWICRAHTGPAWPVWLALFLLAEVLRYSAIFTLGDHWTTRVIVVPGMTRNRRGLYRWIPHPNYLAVALELGAGAMLFGAWRSAIAFVAAHAIVIATLRIPTEMRALESATGSR